MRSDNEITFEDRFKCHVKFQEKFQNQFVSFFENFTRENDDSIHVMSFDGNNKCSQALKTFFSDALIIQSRNYSNELDNSKCHLYFLPVLMMCVDNDIQTGAFWKLNYISDENEDLRKIKWNSENSPYQAAEYFNKKSCNKELFEKSIIRICKEEDGMYGLFAELHSNIKEPIIDEPIDLETIKAIIDKLQNCNLSTIIEEEMSDTNSIYEFLKNYEVKDKNETNENSKYHSFRYDLKTTTAKNAIDSQFHIIYYLSEGYLNENETIVEYCEHTDKICKSIKRSWVFSFYGYSLLSF